MTLQTWYSIMVLSITYWYTLNELMKEI